jgi:TonB family protein
MTPLFEYIVKSLISGVAFWGLYKLLAQRCCNYNFQRSYILLSSLFILIFPLIKIPLLNDGITGTGGIFNLELPGLVIKDSALGAGSIPLLQRLFNGASEISGSLFLACSLFYGAYIVFQLIMLFYLRRYGERRHHDGLDIIINKNVKSPFSFFRWIFLSPGINAKELEQVLCHESSHIFRKHSLDMLLMSAMKIFQWFNPFIFLMGKSLSSIHEYQADGDVLQKGYKLEDYQQLILSLQFGISPLLANRLNNSLTIKRLVKMKKIATKQNSIPGMLSLFLGTLLLFFFISCGGASKEKIRAIAQQEIIPVAGQNQRNLQSSQDTVYNGSEIPFMIVEVKPKFMGGDENTFTKWVFERLVYPQDAKDKGIQGKVTVSFLVKKNGSVADVKVLRGVNELLDKEAVRVVSASPKWTPGKHKGKDVAVRYTFPVIFQLK